MYAKDFLPVAVFLAVGIVFVVITLIAAWFVRPHKPSENKSIPYECGEVPLTPAWSRFRVGYYIYALIFLIFDVDVIFLYPWASSLGGFARSNKPLAIFMLWDMAIFIAVLVLALVYAWKKGVLKWK